jgi:hypothetical protein
VFRATKNALLSYIMRKGFCRHGKAIPHDDIRAMIRALKNNEAVWYAPDQSYRNKGAAMVNFFGIPAATTTATSRLARISGASVLTYFGERLPGCAGYRLTIGPALQNYPGQDVLQDVERFNALLQAQILKVPDQYLWMHRRFKGLTDDYPDYYGRDSRNIRPLQQLIAQSGCLEPQGLGTQPADLLGSERHEVLRQVLLVETLEHPVHDIGKIGVRQGRRRHAGDASQIFSAARNGEELRHRARETRRSCCRTRAIRAMASLAIQSPILPGPLRIRHARQCRRRRGGPRRGDRKHRQHTAGQ